MDSNIIEFPAQQDGFLGQESIIRCHEVQYVDTVDQSEAQIFGGFDEIRVITFSYDWRFLDRLASGCKYMEILFGANFLVERDQTLASMLASTQASLSSVRNFPHLMAKMEDGSCVLRVSLNILDHRKLYLLYKDDERTRCIFGSANASSTAWDQSHMESVWSDTTLKGYQKMYSEFTTAWTIAEEVPYKAVLAAKAENDDNLEENIVIKAVKEKGQITVQVPTVQDPEEVRYVVNKEEGLKKWNEVFKTTSLEAKNGKILLDGTVVKKITKNIQQYKERQYKKKIKERYYPRLRFDLQKGLAFMDYALIDLSPERGEVKKSIENYLKFYEHYDDMTYLGNCAMFKKMHFKLQNYMFCCGFFPIVKTYSQHARRDDATLPMYLLTSGEPNVGKSFCIEFMLDMMTGKNMKSSLTNAKKERTEGFRAAIGNAYGLPYFIDEVDDSFMGHIKSDIKDEYVGFEYQTPILMAGNGLTPDESIRKRLVYISFKDFALRGDVDHQTLRNRGRKLINNINPAFYHAYLAKMIPKVNHLIEILSNSEIDDHWAPDVLAISSETIIEVLTEYGYEIPEYISALTYKDDYAANAKYVYTNYLEELIQYSRDHKKNVIIRKDTVTFKYGTDKDIKKKIKSISLALPNEVRISYDEHPTHTELIVNRQEFERAAEYKFHKGLFGRS